MTISCDRSRAQAALAHQNGHPTPEEQFRETLDEWTFVCPTSKDTTTIVREYQLDGELGFNATPYQMATRRARGRKLIVISSADEEGRKEAEGVKAQCIKAGAAIVRTWVVAGLGTEHKTMAKWCAAYKFAPSAALIRPWECDCVPENGNGATTSITFSRTPPDEEIEPPIVLPEWPAPLDEAAYFGLLGEIVHGIEKETEADPVAILTQLLVGFGNVIGRSAHARVGPAFHYTNEFLLIIGQTSAARKGTAWSEVGRLLEPLDEDWWHRLGPGLSSGEGLIFHVRDEVSAKEALKDKGGRVTEYQDVIIDHGVKDKRLMVVENEFARALQAMQREGSTLNSIVRQAFDGGLLRSLTKGFPYQATGAHISIIGHITATELHKLLASTDLANGFTNRFLWIACRRSRLLPFGGHPEENMIIKFQNRLDDAVDFAKSIEYVGWTKPAMKLWEENYEALTTPRPGALGDVVNRAEAHALRVSVLTALFNKKQAIERPHLEAALAMVAYSERSARYILGDRIGDREEAAIVAYLKCTPLGATRAEIRRAVFHDNKPAHHVQTKLASLLEARSVRREPDLSGVRPTERWFSIVPPT